MVKKITRNDAGEALKSPLAVIDFSATWCGPCNMLAPVLEEVSEEMGDKIAFYNADTDANESLAFKYKIMSIPAIVVLKDGVEAGRQVGFLPKAALKEFLNRYL